MDTFSFVVTAINLTNMHVFHIIKMSRRIFASENTQSANFEEFLYISNGSLSRERGEVTIYNQK